MNKKLLGVVCILLLLVSTAFASEAPVRIMGLKGPTSMGMVHMLQNENYSFTAAGSPDEVVAGLANGTVDIAAVPANLASVLYNKTEGKIKALNINTLGVLYIVELGDSVQSIADLKGKTILSAGMGASPEYALRYILTKNGLNPDTDLSVEFKSEHTEIVSALLNGQATIAVLPQPFVTVAQSQVEGLRVAIDLNKAWEEINPDTAFVTGVTVVQSAFLEQYPEKVQAFLQDYAQSVELALADVDSTSMLIEKLDILKAPIAKKALPYCNICYIDGTEMQEKLSAYLEVLYNANPKSVGGKLPNEDFYVVK